MTRISSLFLASSLAILPIGAFADSVATPAAPAASPSLTHAVPAPAKAVSDKTPAASAVTGATTTDKASGTVTQPVKPDTKAVGDSAKKELHGTNTLKDHHGKVTTQIKS